MMTLRQVVAPLALCLALLGCTSAAEHRRDVQDTSGERMTVGTVQREVRVGMSGAEVAQVLGSPNVVTTDEQRREVWVHDKISTEGAYSTSQSGISALILGGFTHRNALVASAGGASYASADGAASTTQKTLTVIIKFDERGSVRDFAYHTSRF